MGGPQIKGAAHTNFVPVYVASGTITINISTIVRVLPRWIAFVPIEFTGAATDTFTKAFKGSGIIPLPVNTTDMLSLTRQGELFAINGGEEAFTFDYPKPDHDLVIRGNADVITFPTGTDLARRQSQVRLARGLYDQPGTGFLFNFSNAIDRRTSLQLQFLLIYSTESAHGSVASPVIDSWIIADHANKSLKTTRTASSILSTLVADYFDYGFLELPNVAGLPTSTHLMLLKIISSSEI